MRTVKKMSLIGRMAQIYGNFDFVVSYRRWCKGRRGSTKTEHKYKEKLQLRFNDAWIESNSETKLIRREAKNQDL
ncbi:unnamed protein product [Caenorhabditis nigoni]